MSPPAGWSGVRRVLAVRLDNLGDLLMTTPALAAIRTADPAMRLGLLTSPAAAAAAPHLPFVDEVIAGRVPWMPGGADADCAALAARLAAGHWEAAVIFTVCTQSALPAAMLLRAAGIPRVLAQVRENPYALVSDWVRETDRLEPGRPELPPPRHEVQRALDLVAHAGWHASDTRLRFEPGAAAHARIADRLRAAGVGDWAVLHPGASAPSRRWPATRFAAVARGLSAAGLTPVLAGSAEECAPVVSALPPGVALSLAGALDLGELAALIDGARVLVANNSGPAHLAAAVGTPVVCLYAGTNPQHRPWRVPCRVLAEPVPCAPCLRSICPEGHHACLERVTADTALQAARELIAETRPTRPPPEPHPAKDLRMTSTPPEPVR